MNSIDFKKQFAVFILTHRRANNVVTYKTLRKQGYTGKIFLILDNEDPEIELYKKKYKDEVVIFDKRKELEATDSCDNFGKLGTPLFARNACFKIAEEKELKYFVQFDDDYPYFYYTFDENLNYQTTKNKQIIKNLDNIFKYFVMFLKNTRALTIAFAQAGDFIGGANSTAFTKKILRKAMNSFFCSVDKPFKFIGTLNDDVNTYTRLGNLGNLFFTFGLIRLQQPQTQKNSGGITELYLDSGTYVKSFYTIMLQPSSVKINSMGVARRRLHHKIEWNKTVPKILREEFKRK